MCKIMIISGIKKDKAEKAWEFTKTIAPMLSIGNRDGMGYAAIDSDGKVFAERWLENANAFKPNYGLTNSDIKLYKLLGQDLFKDNIMDEYSQFGVIKKPNVVSIMLHARYATAPKGLANVHPFIKNNTAIIHNGTIRNHEKLTKETSTCDSEVILHEYLNYEVSNEVDQIHGVVETIKGGYAVGALSKDATGLPILDIFKSKSPTLYCTFIDELETIVFCTSQQDLVEAVKSLSWNLNRIFEFSDDQHVRFNAVTGEKLASFKIDSIENFSEHHVSIYNQQTETFDDVVDTFKRNVDWVKLIEEEEVKRLSLTSNMA